MFVGPKIALTLIFSFIDILVTFSLLPLNISFFTKKELFYIPLFGWALYSAGMIPVDRYNKSNSQM